MKPDDYHGAKLAKLVDESLAPSDFSHSDHIGVACQALLKHDFFQACALIGDGIRALAVRGGEAEKYSTTITFVFMSIVAERMDSSPEPDIMRFIAGNPDLSERGLLTSVYPQDRLTSPLARQVALLPVASTPPARRD